MTREKRRYFRIQETIGLRYTLLDRAGKVSDARAKLEAIWSVVSGQDEKLERLLGSVAQQQPEVAELVRVLNQKFERAVGQLIKESVLLDHAARKAKEVSISACGIGFYASEKVNKNTGIRLELELYPGNQVITVNGLVVGCEAHRGRFYWRVNFKDMPHATQETLIQHIVKKQASQLKRP